MTSTPLGIADHGLIGDMRSCALVGTDGTIDWFCATRFDSPSVFGAILDIDEGGSWRFGPTGEVTRTQQFYRPDTAVLVTRFLTPGGVAEVNDFMPIASDGDGSDRQRLVRRVRAVRGSIDLHMEMDARPDYARQKCDVTTIDDQSVLLAGGGARMGPAATVGLTVDGGVVAADMHLSQGQTAQFVLELLGDEDEPSTDGLCLTDALFEDTTQFWRQWISQSHYVGRWREVVHRSAITLKLLTHSPSGAVIAAPTTSLPEYIGGERNWDYRYVWMRDAGFTLYALLRLGFTDEARAFIRWLSERLGAEDGSDAKLGPLRVLYDIDGNPPEDEVELENLSGHRDSRPVRIGNAAADQLQLDIYGDLIDSIYLFNKYGPGISDAAWRDVVNVVNWVMDNWDQEDAGMWEVRGETRAFTTSRLMCWVALERAIRVARQRGLPGDIVAWSRARDEIYERIMSRCYNTEKESFTQTENGNELDAGVLLMPMVKFLSPADPRFLSTVSAIEKELVADSLVFRYDPQSDGLDGEEGTFSICSFWYVEALTRTGRLQDAQVALEKMFTYANHLGLYAEQVSATGDQVGNFPQAFTHLALISAAMNLDDALK